MRPGHDDGRCGFVAAACAIELEGASFFDFQSLGKLWGLNRKLRVATLILGYSLAIYFLGSCLP